MKEYLTLFEAYSAACKKRDDLKEGYDAMYRDLRERTGQVRSLREELAEAKQEAESWKAKFKAVSNLYWSNRRSADWISVKDRLPDESGFYLVFRKSMYRSEESIVDVGCYIKPMKLFEGTFDKAVTHWMLLPDSPKEAKHE